MSTTTLPTLRLVLPSTHNRPPAPMRLPEWLDLPTRRETLNRWQDYLKQEVTADPNKGWDNALAALGRCDLFFLLTYLCRRKDANRDWLYARAREVQKAPDGYLDLWARFHYKDLAVDTPVLTTKGWKPHGKLCVGDRVFSPSGKPIKVIATRHFADSACMRVNFDTGASIICGAGHLWRVEVSSRTRVRGTANQRIPRRTLVVETAELAKLQSTYRPIIATTAALQCPVAKLPVDPYVLGAWLGDGVSSSGAICGADRQIFQEIRRAGYRLSPTHCPGRSPFGTHTIYDLRPKLRALGVLNNKHIPPIYLRASAAQRLALLQGLIDTDGSTSAVNRCVTFAQTDLRLIEEVRFLAASLGFKPRVTPVRSTGTWHLTFQALRSQHPCRLKRKLRRLP